MILDSYPVTLYWFWTAPPPKKKKKKISPTHACSLSPEPPPPPPPSRGRGWTIPLNVNWIDYMHRVMDMAANMPIKLKWLLFTTLITWTLRLIKFIPSFRDGNRSQKLRCWYTQPDIRCIVCITSSNTGSTPTQLSDE